MELGHIFQLGTRYSEMMNGKFTNQDGKEALYYMGCYGIGVSRTVAALYEKCVINDEKWGPCGFVLPETILDDRENLTIGAKIKDCKVLGTPYLVVIGDKQEGDMVELENMATGETEVISTNELIKKL